MSDKEERILIIPCNGECNCICPVGNELYCGAHIHKDWVKIDPEKDCKDCLSAAKGDCEIRAYYNIAEAALDALLGGKDV